MKKLILTLAVCGTAMAFTSCKKDCTCTTTTTGVTTPVTSTVKAKNCSSLNTSTTSGTVTIKVDCK